MAGYLKKANRTGDLAPMNHDRAKIPVARALALLVAALLFAFSRFAFRPGLSPFSEQVTSVVTDLALYSALAWAAIAVGPWHRLASAVSWWPGREPHNLYGLAAVITAVLAAAGMLFGGLFVVGCIFLAIDEKLSFGWICAAAIAMAVGAFGVWASPRAHARALKRDSEQAG